MSEIIASLVMLIYTRHYCCPDNVAWGQILLHFA
jgi:hypothetical protein